MIELVPTSVIVMVAPGTIAPCASVTRPVMVARNSCPKARHTCSASSKKEESTKRRAHRQESVGRNVLALISVLSRGPRLVYSDQPGRRSFWGSFGVSLFASHAFFNNLG